MRIKDQKRKNPIPDPQIPDLDYQRMHVAFCLRDIDPNQGDTLGDWAQQNLLPGMVFRIADISKQTMQEARQQQTIKAYGIFPERTKFRHPDHVTEDAEWAAMHIDGKQVLGGHLEKNIFHVVFLDSDHNFFLSGFGGKKTKLKSQR